MKNEVNYTDEMTVAIVEAYVANPVIETVLELAEQFGRSKNSVIAKLSKEGVYQKAVKLNKAGEPAVRKQALVRVISQLVGYDVESLEKASKQDLIRVANALARSQQAVAE
jgi:hypothetical protein